MKVELAQPPDPVCLKCGQPFIPAVAWQLYCCIQCKDADRKRRQRQQQPKETITKVCPICEKEFITAYPRQRLCLKKKCRTQWRREYQREYAHNHYRGLTLPAKGRKVGQKPVKIKCLKCDRFFMSWDRKLNRLCPACSERNNQLWHPFISAEY